MTEATLAVRRDAAAPPSRGERTTRGKLRCRRATFATQFGDPFPEGDLRPWEVGTPGGVARLRLTPDVDPAWMEVQVVAPKDEVLPWLAKAFTGSTACFPDAAAGLPFGDASRVTFVRAYANYLWEYSRAMDWSDIVGREARIAALRRQQATYQRALRMRALVVADEFASAPPERQAELSAMRKPVQGHLSDQAFWWLSGAYPHKGPETLTAAEFQQMVLAEAERSRARSGFHSGVVRDPEGEVEYLETLDALARAEIPGMDSLSQLGAPAPVERGGVG
jgi:hypothetical protein